MEQSRDIENIDRLTYAKPRIDDHTLDDNLLTSPDSSTKLRPRRLRSSASLGALDRLPAELLTHIFCQLDLSSLSDFRSVNSQAMDVVEFLPQYQLIKQHAYTTLCGILQIRTGKWITCEDLAKTICTSQCQQCGDFGGYIYLLTCKQVCFLCFTTHEFYWPLPPLRATRKYGLNKEVLENVPHMTVVPGIYSPNVRKARKCVLVDPRSAFEAGIALHGSISAMEESVADLETRREAAYQMRISKHLEQDKSQERLPRRPPNDPVDGRSGNPYRFVAISSVPWFDKASKGPNWGFHCIACTKKDPEASHWRRKYTVSSFREHLNLLGQIQDGRHQAN